MFEGAPAAQDRVGAVHRQFQRCARPRKSMEIPFLARSIIARLIAFLSSYSSFFLRQLHQILVVVRRHALAPLQS